MRQIFTKTQKMRISAVNVIYCNSCISRTLKCNACSRHDVTLRRAKYQRRTTMHNKTSNSTKTSLVVKDFFSSNLFHAFVFATRIVQFLFFLNPKFQVSSHLLCLYSPVCVGPVRKPHCWFSHEAAQIINR